MAKTHDAKRRWTAALAVAVGLAACGGNDTSPDPQLSLADTTGAVDVVSDGVPDMGLDSVPDTGPDGAADAATDAAGPDDATDAKDGKDGSGKDTSGTDTSPVAPWSCGKDGAVFNVVLGRPTATSITASVMAAGGTEVFAEFGTSTGTYTGKTATLVSASGEPVEVELGNLQANTRYHYRVSCRPAGGGDFHASDERTFQTQRAPGSTFTFGVQGDSHPEREGKMYSPVLYALNMQNVAAKQPDFYFGLGDDFSIEKLLEKNTLSQTNVDAVYLNQRNFFSILGASTSVFLVNGNHEQAAGYLLTDAYQTPYAAAPVMAGKARVTFFPLPAPNGFYTGDMEQVPGVGLLRDYYAWQWGDALFVTLDPYWHSPVPVDTGVPGLEKEPDTWKVSIGDEQYAWLAKTLTESKAKWKFVFEHHPMGSDRGGAGMAHKYEWGGYDQQGKLYQFPERRPTWTKPIHPLLRDTGVTVFFFGHDHLFAREKLDGVVYQSVPNPADNTYTAFNADAYDPETIVYPGAAYDSSYGVVMPDSGFLHVTVSPAKVTVAYVRAVLPADEATLGVKNGAVALTYDVP
ncbi:MAG: metallophosphoesterase [Myxococcota bacterium]